MQILSADFRHGKAKLRITSLDDLWFLSQVLDEGDLVEGSTLRKLKLGGEGERNARVVKKPVFLTLKVEKVEFHPHRDSLRVAGTVLEGPEDVPHGSHHTFDVEDGTVLTLVKPRWLQYQVERLKQAAQPPASKILICVLERDDAAFALLRQYGYDDLGELSGQVEKKQMKEKVQEDAFYTDVITALQGYDTRFSLAHVTLASPAFWKEDLFKILAKKDKALAKKVILATCNATGKNGINEVLNREEVRQVLKQDRVVQETALVEELLKEVGKGQLAVYGLRETGHAAEAGAIRLLLVTDQLIRDLRQTQRYPELEHILNRVEETKGEVHIISVEHEAGQKLHGLGGIGGILRYQLSYS